MIETELLIEVGKSYKLRNGLITSPIRKSNDGTNYIFEADVDEYPGKGLSVMSWLRNGSLLVRNREHKHDIIQEI